MPWPSQRPFHNTNEIQFVPVQYVADHEKIGTSLLASLSVSVNTPLIWQSALVHLL
jgi:hypothetical protein